MVCLDEDKFCCGKGGIRGENTFDAGANRHGLVQRGYLAIFFPQCLLYFEWSRVY